MEEPVDTSDIVVIALLSVFSVVGAVGNFLVLYIYANKKEKSTSGIFIMSLAGTDLITCILIMPYTEAVVYLKYNLHYDVACKVYMFLITCNVPCSAFIMVAIAVDRYFCICHPFLHAITLRRAKFIVLAMVAFASILGLITALLNGVYVEVPVEIPIENSVLSYENASVLDSNETSVRCSSDYSGENRTGDGPSLCANYVVTSGNLSQPITTSLGLASSVSSNSNFTNTTSSTRIELQLQNIGICAMNFLIIGEEFSLLYPKLYSGFYLLSFITVLILYGLIYRSIHQHRAKKSKRKRSSLYPSGGVEFSMVATQMTAVTHVNPHANGSKDDNNEECPTSPTETEPMQKKRKASKPMTIKEKTFCANIRTAAMLFVVTVVFLIAFLPAWLMAHRLIGYNQIVFYMYFVYNSANPFIYAFMNKSFRDDLRKVLKCLKAR